MCVSSVIISHFIHFLSKLVDLNQTDWSGWPIHFSPSSGSTRLPWLWMHTGHSLTPACCYSNRSREAFEDPKGSVCADGLDAEKQKQSGLSAFPMKNVISNLLGKNNQGNVILHSVVNNQPNGSFYKTQESHHNGGCKSLWQLFFLFCCCFWQQWLVRLAKSAPVNRTACCCQE